MKTTLLTFFLVLSIGGYTSPLTDTMDYPVTGRACPGFVLHNISHYPKKEVTSGELKGKWLVLDFWSKGCGACIESFPRVNAMQKEFKDDVQFMLVGIQDKEGKIESMYERFREKQNLVLPCSFDSLLAARWEISGVPHIIIINPQGIVAGITAHIKPEEIREFVAGGNPRLDNPFLYDWQKSEKVNFDKDKLFLAGNNGGTDTNFLFRSLLSGYDPSVQPPFITDSVTSGSVKGRFQVLGMTLATLFNFAWYGTNSLDKNEIHRKPILDTEDSSAFTYNLNSGKNMYCYSLSVPASKATATFMQSIMQRDLESYFGYTATVEKRKFPAWKLVAAPGAAAKLKSKGGAASSESIVPRAEWKFRNWPFERVVILLRNFSLFDTGIEDATGISGNIDMHLNCIMSTRDINDLKKTLNPYGLDLIPVEKELKVLAIKDRVAR